MPPLLTFISLLVSLFLPLSNADAILPNDAITATLYLPAVTAAKPSTWDWQEPEIVEDAEYRRNKVQSIFDGMGRLHLFWDVQFYDAPHFIYHAYRRSDGWVTARPVAPSLGDSELKSRPIVDESGVLHLVWSNEIISGTVTMHRVLYSTFRDGGWSSETELYRSQHAVSGMLQLGTNGQVNLYVFDAALYQEVQHAIREGAGWRWLAPIGLLRSFDWMWPDHSDGVRFYSAVAQEETIYSRWWQGGYVTEEQRLPTFGIRSRTMLLDGRDALHTYWSALISVPGGTARGVHHQCLADDGTLHAVEVASVYDSTPEIHGAVDDGRWSVLAMIYGSEVRLVVWDSCTALGTSTGRHSIEYWATIADVAVNSAQGEVCVTLRQGLDTRLEVICATLR